MTDKAEPAKTEPVTHDEASSAVPVMKLGA
jgi:hypothetical protein